MSLTIELSPTEEARLASASKMSGMSADEWVTKTLSEHWPEENGTSTDILPIKPEDSIHTLFAKWAEEDNNITDEERKVEDLLWADLEPALMNNNGLRLRLPSEW